MEQVTLGIDGMSCNHCVMRVRKALAALPGVTVDDVRIGSARVAFDPASTSVEQVAAAVDAAGFRARAAGSAA